MSKKVWGALVKADTLEELAAKMIANRKPTAAPDEELVMDDGSGEDDDEDDDEFGFGDDDDYDAGDLSDFHEEEGPKA